MQRCLGERDAADPSLAGDSWEDSRDQHLNSNSATCEHGVEQPEVIGRDLEAATAFGGGHAFEFAPAVVGAFADADPLRLKLARVYQVVGIGEVQVLVAGVVHAADLAIAVARVVSAIDVFCVAANLPRLEMTQQYTSSAMHPNTASTVHSTSVALRLLSTACLSTTCHGDVFDALDEVAIHRCH